jgi:putative ABC transport system permease protein
MILQAFAIALRQLGRNKTRTALTSLGILIGVAAVICLVSLGRGAAARIESDLESFGNNLLFVVPGNEGPGGRGAVAPFRVEDGQAIAGQVSGIAAVVPTTARSVRAVRGDQSWRTTVWGTENSWFEVMNWTIASGRTFTEAELRGGSEVCVVGDTVAKALFGAQDPIGGSARLDRLECRVVGTLAPKGENTFGQDQDDLVVVPLRTFQRRISGDRDVSSFLVSARDDEDTLRIQRDIEALLRDRRHLAPGAEDDFFVRDMAEAMSVVSGITTVLTAFLGAVAAISLLVGGIGIMNIMMVSVTERTREIGIRLAVGATARDVLTQFLVEALVLAWVGGVAGVLVGIGASAAASSALDLPLVVDPRVVALAFVVSGGIGVGFGWFPARRASALEPIDALRHE